MDKLRKELSSLRVEKALDIATRDGGFAKEMLLGLAGCEEMIALTEAQRKDIFECNCRRVYTRAFANYTDR